MPQIDIAPLTSPGRCDIRDSSFFSAGHAVFTVSNPGGEHYTYRIVQRDESSPFFVSLLTGPDNMSDYQYLGIYNPRTHQMYRTSKSSLGDSHTPVKVLRWALDMVASSRLLPPGYSIHHEGKCCRCGRRLTTPQSIEAGIGPECSRRPR